MRPGAGWTEPSIRKEPADPPTAPKLGPRASGTPPSPEAVRVGLGRPTPAHRLSQLAPSFGPARRLGAAPGGGGPLRVCPKVPSGPFAFPRPDRVPRRGVRAPPPRGGVKEIVVQRWPPIPDLVTPKLPGALGPHGRIKRAAGAAGGGAHRQNSIAHRPAPHRRPPGAPRGEREDTPEGGSGPPNKNELFLETNKRKERKKKRLIWGGGRGDHRRDGLETRGILRTGPLFVDKHSADSVEKKKKHKKIRAGRPRWRRRRGGGLVAGRSRRAAPSSCCPRG